MGKEEMRIREYTFCKKKKIENESHAMMHGIRSDRYLITCMMI